MTPLKPLKKNSAGLLEVQICVEDAWGEDAERIAAYGELPVVVQFCWKKPPGHGWDPFGSHTSCMSILRELNIAFENTGFLGRARTLSLNRVCEITEVSLKDLMQDVHDY